MKAVIGESDNVTIGLENVTGCNEGGVYCTYSITGDGSINEYGNGYSSGNLPSFTDAKNSSGNKSYTVRLTNSVDYTEKSCTVAFAQKSNCHCTCRSECDNLSTANQIEGQQNSKHCLFATTITEINENYGKHEILVNGQRPGYCSNNDDNNRCTDKLASLEKVDGGYYIETPATSGNDAWLRVTVAGSRTPNCGGGSEIESSSSTETSSESNVNLVEVTKNTTFNVTAGETTIKIKDGLTTVYSYSGCKIKCERLSGTYITIKIGGQEKEQLDMVEIGSPNISADICKDGAISTIELSHAIGCSMDWW
jgi:hypothetical protein